MRGTINEQTHDMLAYTFANFGIIKKSSQSVASILRNEYNNEQENSEKREQKSVVLFEEEIHLHFY